MENDYTQTIKESHKQSFSFTNIIWKFSNNLAGELKELLILEIKGMT